MNRHKVNYKEQNFPKGFLELSTVIQTTSTFERFALLLHSILLEIGFIPRDLNEDDMYKSMPTNWNSSGIIRIQYNHKSLPKSLSWVTCVPMLRNITIQGTLVNDSSENDNVYKSFLMDDYITPTSFSLFTSLAPCDMFTHVEELTKAFKDEFCFALLVLMQQSVDFKPAFGLNGLIDDIMKPILKLLPVESAVALSGVNRNFHCQANSQELWEFMYRRDYGSGSSLESTSEEDWKELYKSEYLKRKRQEFLPHPFIHRIHPSHFYSPPYPVIPNYEFDPRINMDPALQMVFPRMRYRFQRSNWPFGRDNRFSYFGSYW